MSNLKNFIGASRYSGEGGPNVPEALTSVKTSLYNGYESARFPTLDNDGSVIQLPTSIGGHMYRYDSDGSAVWTLSYGNIHADADQWGGLIWQDSVDEALWCFVYDADADLMYLVTVDEASGTVTVIGSHTPPDSSVYARNVCFIERASHGAGDFTVRVGAYVLTVSSSDGSIMSTSTDDDLGAGGYTTKDGKIRVRSGPVGQVANGVTSLFLSRGGVTRSYYDCRVSWGASADATGCMILWGANTVATTSSFSSSFQHGPRFFDRDIMDEYLTALADWLGLPEA